LFLLLSFLAALDSHTNSSREIAKETHPLLFYFLVSYVGKINMNGTDVPFFSLHKTVYDILQVLEKYFF